MLKVALGSDHHGVEYKAQAIQRLTSLGYQIVDYGPSSSQTSSDYPDFAREVAAAVSNKTADRGVLICGSGVGMCITANKFPGVRAAVCDIVECAQLTRRHNGINVLCLSGTVWKEKDLLPVVEAFLQTDFEGGRHQVRLDKITQIEKSCDCWAGSDELH